MTLTQVSPASPTPGKLSTEELAKREFARHASFFKKPEAEAPVVETAAPVVAPVAEPVVEPGLVVVEPAKPAEVAPVAPVVETPAPVEVPAPVPAEVAPATEEFNWEEEVNQIASTRTQPEAPKEQSFIQALNQKYKADFKDEGDFVTYMRQLEERNAAYEKLQGELKNSKEYADYQDPMLKQVVDIYKSTKSVDELVANLSLLQADPLKKTETGQWAIPHAEILRRHYLSEGLGSEEIDELIASKPAADIAILAAPVRKELAEKRKATLAAFEGSKARKEAIKEVEEPGADPKVIEAQVKLMEESLRSVKAINGKDVPDNFRERVVVPLALDPNFLKDIFYDSNGKPRAEVIADAVVRYHPSITEKARKYFTQSQQPDLEVLKRQWRAEFAKERITPSAPALDSAPPAPSSSANPDWWKRQLADMQNGVQVKLQPAN